MKDETGDRIVWVIFVIGGLVIALSIIAVVISGLIRVSVGNTTADFDLYDAQCPFGRYYTDIEGGGFIFVSIDSSLGEGYVFKYFDGDILKTLIVDATNDDVRVHLTNDTTRMWMTVHFEGRSLETSGVDEGRDWLWMDVYVPDPKLMAAPPNCDRFVTVETVVTVPESMMVLSAPAPSVTVTVPEMGCVACQKVPLTGWVACQNVPETGCVACQNVPETGCVVADPSIVSAVPAVTLTPRSFPAASRNVK